MLLGYIRVSKSDGSQSLDLQRDALLAAGVAPDRIYEDYASGRHDARPGLEACLKALRPDDTLVVWKLDRLGRSLKNLIDVVTELDTLGIGFRSVTENMDTTTSGGKLVFHIFGPLTEFERDLIRERARGHKGGHPRVAALDDEKKIAMARTLNVSYSTLYR